MMTKQRMQQIYDNALRNKGLDLTAGGGVSLSNIRDAFIAMREGLDAENATQEAKKTFAQTIQDAIDAGIWRVPAQRETVGHALSSTFAGMVQEPQGDAVVSPSLRPVRFDR